MSEEITIVLPATIIATGSDETIAIDTSVWPNPQAMADYLLNQAVRVILQRASAGKNDDAEKAAKAVKAVIARLLAGEVPTGGGFTKLSPEDYAMKETLMASKVKFEKGESVADVLARLAAKLTETVEVDEEATDEEKVEAAELFAEAASETQAALTTELQASEVYKSALKARNAKAKSANKVGSLMDQL